MSDWIPFTPTYTYKRPWWRKLMFWRKQPKVTAIYKQIGKTVHIKTNPTKQDGDK